MGSAPVCAFDNGEGGPLQLVVEPSCSESADHWPGVLAFQDEAGQVAAPSTARHRPMQTLDDVAALAKRTQLNSWRVGTTPAGEGVSVCRSPAPAKNNRALNVRRRRDDGYHELETLFAFCRDGDVVTVERAGATSLTLTGPFAKILAGEVQDDNLVMRAARGFVARFGVEGDHAITLDKHLPVASGIGGGSADAAATLRALAKLHGVAVDHPELFALAGELGADVPACLLGRIALGQGAGSYTPLTLPTGPLSAAQAAAWIGVKAP